MKHKRTNGTTGGMSGRASAGTRLLVLSDGPRSPASVGPFAMRMQEPMRRQDRVGQMTQGLPGRLGEGAGGNASLLAIEMLRMLALRCAVRLGEREEPVKAEEIASLALTLRRIESADRLRRERERMAAKAASRGGGAAQDGDLTAETVFAIRRAAEGKCH